ncbi:MAG: CoA-binding protein [Chlorobiaceae bacterium]|nr:CoA-binding protein [Chlorobiaceae bacterium]MBA4309739.1 CoA-binding protein [Chlorobiaceae bacterium]
MKSVKEILSDTKTIAVIGISDKPNRDSGSIAKFLLDKGYNVVGVHPTLKDVFGIKVYKSLDEIPHKIDLVNVFLASEKIPEIIPSVEKLSPKYLWLQLGVRNDNAVKLLIEKGVEVIQDKCIAVEYRISISNRE